MSEDQDRRNKKTPPTSGGREPARARGLVGKKGRRDKESSKEEPETSIEPELDRAREEILKCFPPGLVKSLRNLQERSQQIRSLYYGLTSKKEVIEGFREKKKKDTGKYLAIRDKETGEIFRVPIKSRWNGMWAYQKKVWRQLMAEVKGLKATKILTLTFDPKRVELIMPDWWTEGYKAFLIAVWNEYLNGFLKRLRDYDKRHGKPFNYIAAVMEFHESGQLHYHLLFYGNWIAPLADIQKMWPFSEPQGVDLGTKSKSGNGYSAVAYMTKYVTGMMQEIAEGKNEEWYAWVWYFRKRLFNTRHHRQGHNRTERRRNPDGTFAIEEKEPGRFECIGHWVSETEVNVFTRYKDGPGDIGLKDVKKLMAEYAAGNV